MTGNRKINLGSGNYNEGIEGDYIEQKGNFGVGVNKGTINTEKLAGSINEAQQKTLAQAAAEIQELLEQLDKTYDTGTTSGKMQVASETIKTIENNPDLKARIISALKAGGAKALEKLLNHPAATFVVAALEDWQKTSNKFLEAKPKTTTKQIIYFGMFSGSKQSSEEDFKIAEFTGDYDDNLDWS